MKTARNQNLRHPCASVLLQGTCAALLAAALLPLNLDAFSGTPPTGRTGAPGSAGTCATCHTSVGSGTLDLDFSNTTLTYEPGETYMIDANIDDAGQKRFGFSMVARTDSNPTISTGTWTAGNDSQVYNGGDHVGHQDAPFADDIYTFGLSWTAPLSDVGPITFFVAANAANGNGANQAGDNVYLESLTINPATVSATWGGYDIVDDVWIDTGSWLGWLALFDTNGGATWAYSLNLDNIFYISKELAPSDPGVWIYTTRE